MNQTTMSSNSPPHQLKSSSGTKKPKLYSNNSSSTGMNTYQTQYQKRSEPPFPLYPSVVPTNHTNHDIDDDDDDDDDHDKDESSQWSLDDPRNTTTPTLEQGWNSVVQLLRGRKRIAILTGAGISVSCGIPDFRTKGSGLYSTLDTAALGLTYPEDLFDAHFFRENPAPFYKFARRLYFPFGTTNDVRNNPTPIRAKPSDSHKLLSLLEDKKMLLRVYSQNIDGLEEEAGVSAKKICYAHGSLHWATCCKCKRKVNTKEIESNIIRGTVPYCQAPVVTPSSPPPISSTTTIVPREPSARVAAATAAASTRKRLRSMHSASDEDDEENNYTNHTVGKNGETVCGGIMKPGITFFGEALHNNVKTKLESDREKVDALIVIGTSLSVAPISKVIDYLPKNIPRILINRTIVHPPEPVEGDDDNVEEEGIQQQQKRHDFRKSYVFDAYLLGYCDVVTRALGYDLFNTDTTSSNTNKGLLDAALLTTVLKSDDPYAHPTYHADEWSSVQVPSDRVFLFEGAQPPQTLASASTGSSSHINTAGDISFREIAHCDGCTKRIEGTIQKCVVCFDYDLCQNCYPTLSKVHYDGKHHFAPEAIVSE